MSKMSASGYREICGGAVRILLMASSLQAAAAAGPGKAAKPAMRVGPNVRMNGPQSPKPDGALGRVAQGIAADAAGQRLVAGWESMQGICGGLFAVDCKPPKTPGINVYGYSTDGGRTWTEIGAPYLGDEIMTSGRPWIDRGGADGQTFFTSSRASIAKGAEAPAVAGMGQGKGQTPGGLGQIGVVVYRGRFKPDGAFAWTDQHLFKPKGANDLLRSPSVLAAKDGSGKIWVALSPLLEICGFKGGSGGQIEVYRSEDEGKTWSDSVVVSKDDFLVTPDPKDPKCGSQGTIQLSPNMALGPKGELYIVWEFGPKLLSREPLSLNDTAAVHFARSLDGGRTFTAPQEIAAINTMRSDVPVGYSKITINDFPRIAVDAKGPHRGRIYVAYNGTVKEAPGRASKQNLVSSEAWLIHSDDQGATWSKPVPLAPPVPETGVKRFWPTVAVRDDGAVDVVYFEEQEKQLTPDPDDDECDIGTVFDVHRKGKVSSLMDLYWVQSNDGGATFSAPVRVNTETTNWCKVKFDYSTTQFANFGDILGLYTTGARTFAVWPDGRNGVPDAYFAELGAAAAKTAAPKKPKK
jgi:hypothetical protein